MTSFRRLKGMAKGGPDGGDGGSGGDIFFEATTSMTSLLDFKYTAKYQGEDGEAGGTNNCTGRCGAELIIKAPLGTIVKDAESGMIIADLYYEGEKKLIVSGGRGGKGNLRFTTSKRHTPHFSQKGEKTKIRTLILELKTIADVGIIGFPNVGKSTLLSKISAAKPKIANYHFTTLSPNLGVVKYYDKAFVAADIPGLIEGASEGNGLGIDFLKHIERTRMLCHVIDISGVEGRDPYEDFLKINEELKNYSEILGNLKQVIAANKCDIYGAKENLKIFKQKIGRKYKVIPITAINGDGTETLIKEIFEKLEKLPPAKPIEHEIFEYEKPNYDNFEIVIDEDGAYVVIGDLVNLLSRNVVLDDIDSLAYFQKTLREKGVIKALRKAGAKDGDIVVIGEIEFDYVE
jgi:GTP-binding protein